MRPIVLILATLLLAACGKSPQEAAVAAATGGKVDQDGDKTTVQTDQGTITYNAAQDQALPANFPKDVFLPKDYTVRSSMDMNGALMVDLVTDGKPADVFAATGAAMPGMGWKQTAAMQQQGNSVLVFENDAQMVQYSFLDDEPGKAHLSVAITKKGQ
ncbi:MAG: hypothetical protein ACREO3_11200 [Arenimonas sp.]